MAKEHHARLRRAAGAREGLRGERSAIHPIPCPARPTLLPVAVLLLFFLLPILNSAVAFGAEFYVAPNGSAAGDGSYGNPWSLAKALSHPAAVRPGDRIWLRGGNYVAGGYGFVSNLTGTAANPIIVRNYSGERVTLNPNQTGAAGYEGGVVLNIYGNYTWYWGLEIADPSTESRQSAYPGDVTATDIKRRSGVGIVPTGQVTNGVKLINLVVHDLWNGFGMLHSGDAQTGGTYEVHGCLVYYNGYRDSNGNGQGGGVYASNTTGFPLHENNIYFHNFRYNAQFTTQGPQGRINNYVLRGNTFALAGGLIGNPGANITFGTDGGNGPSTNNLWDSNYTYSSSLPFYFSHDIGRTGLTNTTLTNNYLWGSTAWQAALTGLVMQGNTFGGDTLVYPYSGQPPAPLNRATFPNNTYLSYSRPTGTNVFVRPNAYEPGRANITVYNWDLQGTVDVNVSAVLNPGDQYEVRNALDFFGTPVTSGVYDGQTIRLPMTGLTVARPAGYLAPSPAGPEFNVFVLLRTAGSSGCDPTYGDLNQDGPVNAADLVILGNYLVGNLTQGSPPFTAPLAKADLDRSGSVNATDHLILQNYLVGNLSCLPR